MLLKPFGKNPEQVQTKTTEMSEGASVQILEAAGLLTKASKGDSPTDSLRKALLNNGAGLDEVASNLRFLMENAETDGGKISAIKMIAAAHGALQDLDNVVAPSIVINIQNLTKDGGNSAINLLMPRTN